MIVRGNRLIADDGMMLVSIDGIIAADVWLSPSDSIANWREITEEEAQRIEEQREKEIDDYVVE